MELDRVFAVDGPLAARIAGFQPRTQQRDMAQAIAHTIETNGVLVAEAGTGTGKTFAYLAPALLSGGKTIISTGTKTLQDQLFKRDLPAMRDALRTGATIALLKGRANYVCPYHLERAQSSARLGSREEAGHLQRIVRFAQRTKSGDKAECTDVPENSGAWAVATSTRENCLGTDCPNHAGCFVIAARQEALAADIVVVNHHLFFADVMLKDDGMGELLPACNTVVFDEAHQLPDVAGLFFGEAVSSTQLLDLVRDARLEALAAAKDYAPLQDAVRDLEKAVRDFRLVFRGDNLRLTASRAAEEAGFDAALAMVGTTLEALGTHLESQAARGEGLESCHRRSAELLAALQRWQRDAPPANPEPDEAADGEAAVKWVEVYTQSLSLNRTPLDIGPIFRRQMEGHPRAWVFTSATLAVGNDFSLFCGEMGLTEAQTQCWGSPFDYAANALLYAPNGLPDPNSAGFQDAVVDAAWPALRAAFDAGRGSFVLCTSLRAMRRIHELLLARRDAAGLDVPLLLQGETTRTELLDRFRLHGNAILVASQSFWEGVDVRGEALSLVVIDKLPFAPPDDPVLAARIERLRERGGNPFMEYQLPRAVISMKQGAGRLIRDETDRGVLMICDPRMIGKPYGRRVWQSLPPMRRTRDMADVEQFFDALASASGAAATK